MKIRTVDDYIAQFPPRTRRRLRQLRALIKTVARDADEKLAYGVPTFFQSGNLVHFGAFEHHIGFYPGPDAILRFKKDLSGFATSKGAVRFPLDQPLPVALVRMIVAYRVEVEAPFPSVGRPALRALQKAKVKDIEDLARKTEATVAALHGIGPKAMGILKAAMRKRKLKFAHASKKQHQAD